MLNSSTTPSHSSKAFWSRLFPCTSKPPGSKHLERGFGCSLPGPLEHIPDPQCFFSKWVESSQTFHASGVCLGRFDKLSTSSQNASEMSHFTSNVFFFKYHILGWQKQELVRAIFVFSEKPGENSGKWKSQPVLLHLFPPSLPHSLDKFYKKWPKTMSLLLLTREQDVWIHAGSICAGLGQPRRMWNNGCSMGIVTEHSMGPVLLRKFQE